MGGARGCVAGEEEGSARCRGGRRFNADETGKKSCMISRLHRNVSNKIKNNKINMTDTYLTDQLSDISMSPNLEHNTIR